MDREKARKIIYFGVLLFAVIILFTAIDYYFHDLRPEWAVPDRYFQNKIIFGFLYGAVLFFITSRIKYFLVRPVIFSLLLSVFLQARYFYEGYDLKFVIIFFFIHFVILLFLSYPMFYISNFTLNKIEFKDKKFN